MASAFEKNPIIKRISLKNPWNHLVPWLRIGLKYALSKKSDTISQPWPDIIIASGRRSTAASLFVKSQNPKTKVIQIQNPGISSRYFDLLITPQHDNIERFVYGNNVIRTLGALHCVTAELLSTETKKFSHLKNKSKKCVVVLIGGDNRNLKFMPHILNEFCKKLLILQEKENITLLITTSRRTGEENIRLLCGYFNNRPDTIFFNPLNNSANPYYGFLGLGDAIIVTGDSISMISEACATGKSVFIFQLPRKKSRKLSRQERFHEKIMTMGRVKIFNGEIEYQTDLPPLDDMNLLAEKVRSYLENTL